LKYILAHDLGTSGNKATLFNEKGQLIQSEVFHYETDYFNGTWAEQDPEDWWEAICVTTKQLIEKSGISNKDIAVISFSGQMMGCLCVDKSGTPLRKSIIWADQRAQKQAEELGQKISLVDFYHIVGHRNTASYGIQKLMWVRDNEPEIYENTYITLNAKDFIIFRLTGKFYTEPSDGTSNACIDLKSLKWSERILDYARIDGDKLPELVPSTHIAGGVTAAAAAATGLAVDTPVVMGGGDGCCANVGAGSIKPGKTFSYIGSSAWIASTTEVPVFDDQMRTITWAHIVPGLYAPNGTMQCAGGSYNWLKTQIAWIETAEALKAGVSPYDFMNQEGAKSPVGSNGLIFLPYLLGERAPRWNVNAKGAFIGLKMESKRSDVFRSVLEGITLNLNIILEVLRNYIEVDEILVIGGGAKGQVWRQIMADVYNVRIVVPRLLEEATSMGAAVTGGVGVGLFKDFSAIDSFLEIQEENLPDPDNALKYKNVKEMFDLCYFSLLNVFDKMSE